MAVRKDKDTIEIDLYNIEDFRDKVEVRDFLLKTWIAESPKCKYRYFVEKLPKDLRIYLERPGRLNKGCDFVIYVENFYEWGNGNDRPPDHDFVLNDVEKKSAKMNSKEWENLLISVRTIYNIESFEKAREYVSNLPSEGLPYEVLLKLIRWFFNEQDLTYWSGMGREMFLNAIISRR